MTLGTVALMIATQRPKKWAIKTHQGAKDDKRHKGGGRERSLIFGEIFWENAKNFELNEFFEMQIVFRRL